MLEEPLLFEIGDTEKTGVDFADVETGDEPPRRSRALAPDRAGRPQRTRSGAPLHPASRQNYAIDLGLFPLGSCTMKHNPRLNEKVARLPGFADIHPLQPVDTVQGALELIDLVGHWLVTLTGMHSVAMSPKAGAHGELCGLLAHPRRARSSGRCARSGAGAGERARHQSRDRGLCRLSRREHPGERGGRVDLDALKARLDRTSRR